MKRATRSCAREKAVVCRVAPIYVKYGEMATICSEIVSVDNSSGRLTIIHTIANHIDFRGPSRSPVTKEMMVPLKQPRLYIDTMIPRIPALGRCTTSRKSSLPTIPENTPWSYP